MKRVQKTIEHSYFDRSYVYRTEDKVIEGTYIGLSADPDDTRWVIQWKWETIQYDYPLLSLEDPRSLTVLP